MIGNIMVIIIPMRACGTHKGLKIIYYWVIYRGKKKLFADLRTNLFLVCVETRFRHLINVVKEESSSSSDGTQQY